VKGIRFTPLDGFLNRFKNLLDTPAVAAHIAFEHVQGDAQIRPRSRSRPHVRRIADQPEGLGGTMLMLLALSFALALAVAALLPHTSSRPRTGARW
jgi:hypothetical protein